MVFLQCSTNNRAETVYQAFIDACSNWNIPSRVRSDYGGENVMVADFMLEERGMNRGSFITGTSVHNQRIERLWRDVHRVIVSHFVNLFYFMEQSGFLDPLNEHHLFALHYVFLPRLNRACDEFVAMSNHRPMRTARNLSPLQVHMQGCILYNCPLPNEQTDIVNFGVEDDDDVIDFHVEEDNSWENVQVPEVAVAITEDQLNRIRESIDTLAEDGNFGINNYLSVLRMLTMMDN